MSFNCKNSKGSSDKELNDSKLTVYKFWWNQIIINKFPLILKVSCDILSIPATQTSCESF